jgi:hypothetical protein
LRHSGKCTVVTNLAPRNVVQGVTDPRALQRLSHSISNVALWHLPRLHAKVYVADSTTAIVTPGISHSVACGRTMNMASKSQMLTL